MIAVLVCENCEEKIGTFETDTISLPLTPDQFLPLEAGFSPPFQPEMVWECMNCPHCYRRAMGWDTDAPDGVRPDRVMTGKGYFVVPDRMPEVAVVAMESAVEPAPVERVKRAYTRKDKKRGR